MFSRLLKEEIIVLSCFQLLKFNILNYLDLDEFDRATYFLVILYKSDSVISYGWKVSIWFNLGFIN